RRVQESPVVGEAELSGSRCSDCVSDGRIRYFVEDWNRDRPFRVFLLLGRQGRLDRNDPSLRGLLTLEFFYIEQLFDETQSNVLDSSVVVLYHCCLLFCE